MIHPAVISRRRKRNAVVIPSGPTSYFGARYYGRRYFGKRYFG